MKARGPMYPNTGLAAHHSTANKLRGKLWRGRKILYSKKPAIWGEGGLMFKDQLGRLKGKEGKNLWC